MTKINIEHPKIPHHLPSANFHEIFYRDEPYLHSCIISNSSVEREKMERIEFSQVIFKNVIIHEVSFKNIELTDVVFENCDLSNADITEGIIHRV